MIANYYTLLLIAKDLDRRMSGCVLAEAFSQQRNEVALRFISPAVENPERVDSEFLVVSCEPSQNHVYARPEYHRAKRNSIDLLQSVVGRTVECVELHPADREIRIRFRGGHWMAVQMFGSKANVMVGDEKNNVIDAFLKKKELAGTTFVATSRSPDDRVISSERWQRCAVDVPTLPVLNAVKKMLPHFGTTLVRESLFRSGIAEQRAGASLTPEESERLVAELRRLEDELTFAAQPRIYFDGDVPIQLSIVELRHLASHRAQMSPNIHAAVRMFISSSRRSESFTTEKDRIEHALLKEKDHVSRTVVKIASETPAKEYADELELKGKLITANLHTISKGLTETLVENVLSEQREIVEIKLDPHLSPAKNAGRYFDKARKARDAYDEQAKRQSELSRQLRSVGQLLDTLSPLETPEELAAYLESHKTELREIGIAVGKHPHQKPQEQLPFRVFTVAGGFQVWAGKSGENNDLLTTRHTAKNDLWFHARGVGGSHVVLKVGTAKGEPSKGAIEQAASVAAYYSKMKSGSMVPVAMCEGKYVRKPKGAPAGTVMIERERILFVEPVLPTPPQPSH